MSIEDGVVQAGTTPAAMTIGPEIYKATLAAWDGNSERILIGNVTSQNTELFPGDTIDTPGDSLENVYFKGNPAVFTIVAVDTGSDWFEIDGDETEQITAGDTIEVVGSTGNDGIYTIASTSFASGKTRIFVNEDVTDANSDGNIQHGNKLSVFGRK